MASFTSRVFPSLGQRHLSSLGLKPSSRASYATDLATFYSLVDKGLSARDARGPVVRKRKRDLGEPRTEKMHVDQDWTAVYPAAAVFKPHAVPLPVRMGYPVNRGVPPGKEGNLELIKGSHGCLSVGGLLNSSVQTPAAPSGLKPLADPLLTPITAGSLPGVPNDIDFMLSALRS